MYYLEMDPDMGEMQNPIFMTLYSNEHQVLWSTMFGSEFDHIDEWTDGFQLNRGLDFGVNLIWVEGEVLYLVGTTGGYNYERECPYPAPGPSYCELTEGPLSDGVDAFDGMIARFDMRDILIGLQEFARSGSDLLVFPSPAKEYITIQAPGSISAGSTLQIFDPIGKLVLQTQYTPAAPIGIGHLAEGVYAIRITDKRSGVVHSGRFVRQ